jgi:hypothetical protein
MQSAKDILEGKLPAFYTQYDKDWASYNDTLVLQYRQPDLPGLLEGVKNSHRQLITYLESLTPEQFLTDQGVRHGNYKVIISRLIVAETKDERKHLAQIQSFLHQNQDFSV